MACYAIIIGAVVSVIAGAGEGANSVDALVNGAGAEIIANDGRVLALTLVAEVNRAGIAVIAGCCTRANIDVQALREEGKVHCTRIPVIAMIAVAA